MIISPPYLLPRNANESDEAWINRCMPGGEPGDGAYPLSHALQWHGGLHLREPEAHAPVRAIADGRVVFVRPPLRQPAGPLPEDHAQAYRGGWTDNGVVVLRHDTEIGEGANASVTFFSIYMHLGEIDAAIKKDGRVYRKSPLGRAGQIYGDPGRLHFEIVCDDANVQRLVGRTSGKLNTAANGRTDAVYGSMHFRLPADTLVYPARPALNLAQGSGGVPIGSEVFVELRYANGEGAAGNRGDAYLSTYQPDGTRIGQPLEENDAEYNLYRDANTISQAYPPNARPAPSAVYELLRFGRVIGPDALNPANVPHWRRIHHPGGAGWVNLNAANVTMFSDADFPHWMGWSLVDDSADQDSRCDSPTLKGWLDVNGDGKVAPAEAMARMGSATVAPKLAKAICKFPTEWKAASFDQRLGWIKTSTAENPNPVDATNFERLRDHVAALAFWPGNTGLPESHWHWNPRAFIGWFRKCGWLDDTTLFRLYPKAADGTRNQYRIELNQIARKYFISSNRHRMTHFLGQGAHESAQLNGMIERGNTSGSRQPEVNGWYDNPAETYFNMYRDRNGNIESRDGIKFRGRGMKQLTGRSNYGYYWAYRGWIRQTSFSEPWWSPARIDRAPAIENPQFAGNDAYTTIDAGGWYWESTPIRGLSNGLGRPSSSINVLLDRNPHSDDLVRLVARQINGGEIGLPDRRFQTQRVHEILRDG
jgi:hydroxyethylthiazole kinase